MQASAKYKFNAKTVYNEFMFKAFAEMQSPSFINLQESDVIRYSTKAFKQMYKLSLGLRRRWIETKCASSIFFFFFWIIAVISASVFDFFLCYCHSVQFFCVWFLLLYACGQFNDSYFNRSKRFVGRGFYLWSRVSP